MIQNTVKKSLIVFLRAIRKRFISIKSLCKTTDKTVSNNLIGFAEANKNLGKWYFTQNTSQKFYLK